MFMDKDSIRKAKEDAIRKNIFETSHQKFDDDENKIKKKVRRTVYE